jgi:hypothetical protein
MKIDVETKYNVDDIVWISYDTENEEGFMPFFIKISSIVVETWGKSNIEIRYFAISDDVDYFGENLVYATKAECQVDCNRLNHGIDIDKKVKQ